MQLLQWDKAQAFHFHDSTFGGCTPSLLNVALDTRELQNGRILAWQGSSLEIKVTWPFCEKLMKTGSVRCTGGSRNAAWSVLTGLRLLMQREGLASEGAPCYYRPGLEAMALPAGLGPCQTLSGTSKRTFLCFFLHCLSSCLAGGR